MRSNTAFRGISGQRVSKITALLVAHALLFTSMPAYPVPRRAQEVAESLSRATSDPPRTPAVSRLAAQAEPKPPPVADPRAPNVKANRTVPPVTSSPATATFSATPSAAEFLQARVFAEPFVPVGGEPSLVENAALAAAVTTYLQGKDPEDLTAFGVFLNDHPTSAWRASLVTNLGALYRRPGTSPRRPRSYRKVGSCRRTRPAPLRKPPQRVRCPNSSTSTFSSEGSNSSRP